MSTAVTTSAAAPARTRGESRLGRIGVVAREEYRRALETRWLFGFTALFAAMVLGVSYFGLVQSGEVGFQGFSRVTLSLLNLVLFTVPLTGLILGVGSVSGSAETLPLLLAQPVGRGEVLAGKYLGLVAALSAAQALGFGAGGLIVALQAGPEQIRAFVVLTGVSLLLGALSLAAALALASILADRVKALAAAIFLWLLLVVAYDLGVLGATALLRGLPLQSVLFPALLLNPVDLARVLVTLAVGSGALFGPTSAVLVNLLGGSGGALLGFGALLVQTAVPLAVAARVFGRRDW